MKKLVLLILTVLIINVTSNARQVASFELEDIVSNTTFKLQDYNKYPAVILIFTSNNCPFAKLYEDRLINLQKSYMDKSVIFAFINPHHGQSEEESTNAIKSKIAQKGIKFAYLIDSNQSVTKSLKASKLPEAYVLTPSPTGFSIAYHGAIDNNAQLPNQVTKQYLKTAIDQVLADQHPIPNSLRAVGCNIVPLN
ncbi:redoxin domain-containing protein [Echinicola sp. 20G]|uniref:redoxin domain-containing protein n=1 Tax=Echinicola sp. 20G TaxID=2781961 RepID=UPI0019101045|nr:redoxin domain-containing protein [Echinicola sp. 20G]